MEIHLMDGKELLLTVKAVVKSTAFQNTSVMVCVIGYA